jgi:hypothetical protein
VVGDEREVARTERGGDATRSVGHDEGARAEGEQRAGIEDHVIGAVTFVQVDAPGQRGHDGGGAVFQAADDQLAGVT